MAPDTSPPRPNVTDVPTSSPSHDVNGTIINFPHVERVIPYRWHPESREIRAECTRWAERFLPNPEQFLPETERSRREWEGGSVWHSGVSEAGLWSVVCYPDMDTERVLDIAKICVSLYWLDDLWHTNEPDKLGLLTEAADVLVNGPPGPGASATAHVVWESWHPVLARASDAFRPRLIETALRFIRGTAMEMVEFADPEEDPQWALTDQTYLSHRLNNMAANFIWVMVEYCLGIDLAAEFAAYPPLRDNMHRLGCEHFCYVNDLLSYRKECFDEEENVSYITRFLNQGVPLQEAFDRLAGMVEGIERRYLSAANQLRLVYAKQRDVEAWLTGMLTTNAGAFEYSYVTARYQGRGASVEDPHGPGLIPRRRTGPMLIPQGPNHRFGTSKSSG
ncbi:terpene synthase family protein [Streptomyces sp. NPDC060131]|uniref:terpene synthase family protein n=1 Tax=unclassified Streptomyces TaxID=2593676 RepID=UPI00366005E9